MAKLEHGQPVNDRQAQFSALDRVVGDRDEEHMVDIQRFPTVFGQDEMADLRRIE